jgi:hypothetical protein
LYCQSFFDLYLLDYPFGIFWSLYCQYFFDMYLLDYPFGIFWSEVIKKVQIKEELTIQ